MVIKLIIFNEVDLILDYNTANAKTELLTRKIVTKLRHKKLYFR